MSRTVTVRPSPVPLTGISPAITLLPVEDAIPGAAFKGDPTYLGEGLSFVVAVVVIPVVGESRSFHSEGQRTDLIRNAFMAVPGLGVSSQSGDRLQPKDGDLVVSARLKAFEVDTGFDFFLPLIISNGAGFFNTDSRVVLDCQVFQPGNPAPLWQGTVEGEAESTEAGQDEAVIQESVAAAVAQFVQKSNIRQLSAQARNGAFGRRMQAGQARETAGDWKGAIGQYREAYGTATTSEQSLDAIKAVARYPEALGLPEEARRFKVQAEDLVKSKKFAEAASAYRDALWLAPWWSQGHFNLALLLGETKQNTEAVSAMKKYQVLAPNAENARAAQDKIYLWESQPR